MNIIHVVYPIKYNIFNKTYCNYKNQLQNQLRNNKFRRITEEKQNETQQRVPLRCRYKRVVKLFISPTVRKVSSQYFVKYSSHLNVIVY